MNSEKLEVVIALLMTDNTDLRRRKIKIIVTRMRAGIVVMDPASIMICSIDSFTAFNGCFKTRLADSTDFLMCF